MFPIPWNFPLRKKNGNLVNIGDAIDEGTELPSHGEGDAGKVLSVDENGDLEWSDDVNTEIQTLTNNLDDEVETRAKLTAHNLLPHIIYTDSSNDVHFSIDKDGIVILYTEASGATSDTSFSVSSNGERNLTYETGNYYLSGCPSDGNNNIAVKLNPRDGSNVYDYGNSALISLSGTDIYKVEVWIKSGTIITTPITFKPMVTLATDARHSYSDFTPYVPTNAELLSADTNAVLGAHNLLPNRGKNATQQNVVATYNSDGTITLNNTAANDTDFTVVDISNPIKLPVGTYKLSGANKSVNSWIYVRKVSVFERIATDTGDGVEFTIDSTLASEGIAVYVRALNGTTYNNTVIYPMIRLASDPSTEYTPYAMTNRELTDNVNKLNAYVTLSSTDTAVDTNGRYTLEIPSDEYAKYNDLVIKGYNGSNTGGNRFIFVMPTEITAGDMDMPFAVASVVGKVTCNFGGNAANTLSVVFKDGTNTKMTDIHVVKVVGRG